MTNRDGDNLIHFGGNESLVRALGDSGVRFLVVGGLALSWHFRDRQADDMDLMLDPSPENAERVVQALAKVGLHAASAQPFAQTGKQFPLKGGSLYAELLTPHPDGITYADADADAVPAQLFGIPVRLASMAALRSMKQQAADSTTGAEQRKHLDDIERLDGGMRLG